MSHGTPAQSPSHPDRTSASKSFLQLSPSDQLAALQQASTAATAKQQALHHVKNGSKSWDPNMTLEEKSLAGDAFGAYFIGETENEGEGRDESKDEFRFEIVPNLFRQSDGSTPKVSPEDMLANSFGLVDSKSEDRWKVFQDKIADLQKSAPKDVTYKVMFCGRHGQGYHNYGAELYDAVSWELDWAKKFGNGDIVWGPDPELTPLGEAQARAVHAGWVENLANGCPRPETWIASPFTRAINTMYLSFGDILDGETPTLVEGVREIYGIHTCDLRVSKTDLHKKFPKLAFEEGFAEEDPLWKEDEREAEGSRRKRLRAAMFELYGSNDKTYISISSHSCALRSLLAVLNHTPISLETGEMIPVVVKATKQH